MPPSRLPAARSDAPVPANRLVLATGNAGKLRELRALLEGLPLRPEPLSAFDVESPDETGSTFLDNALLKARHAARATGAAVIADDSGLEVDALGGAPGVWSARYAGPQADDAANNAKLVAALAAVPQAARTARYRCVLVYLSEPEAEPLVAEGVWEGTIVAAPRGAGGFGYDPHFWLPALGLTAAELAPGEKNRISHRAIALRALRAALERRL